MVKTLAVLTCSTTLPRGYAVSPTTSRWNFDRVDSSVQLRFHMLRLHSCASSIKCLSLLKVMFLDHLQFLASTKYVKKKTYWEIWDILPRVEFVYFRMHRWGIYRLYWNINFMKYNKMIFNLCFRIQFRLIYILRSITTQNFVVLKVFAVSVISLRQWQCFLSPLWRKIWKTDFKNKKQYLRQASKKNTLGHNASCFVFALSRMSIICTLSPSGQASEVWSPWLLIKQIKLPESGWQDNLWTVPSKFSLFRL